jgi:hypothetical protein
MLAHVWCRSVKRAVEGVGTISVVERLHKELLRLGCRISRRVAAEGRRDHHRQMCFTRAVQWVATARTGYSSCGRYRQAIALHNFGCRLQMCTGVREI